MNLENSHRSRKLYVERNSQIRKFDSILSVDAPYIDESSRVVGYYQELVNVKEIDEDANKEKEYDMNEENNALDIDEYDEKFSPSETFTDPVGKFRVSEPQSLIDTDFEYGTQTTKWENLSLVNNRPASYSSTVPLMRTHLTSNKIWLLQELSVMRTST